MPKVVHVLRKFEPAEWGGVETHLVGIVPELERLGWISEVHAPAEAGTDGAPLRAVGASFSTYRAHYPRIGMSAAERARLVASGGNLVTFDEIVRLLVDRRASLLHAHTQRRAGGVVRFAARRKGVPYAVTIHGPLRAGGEGGAAAAAFGSPAVGRGVDVGAPFGLLVGAHRVVQDADLVFVLNERERAAWQAERSGRHLARIPHGLKIDPASMAERAAARGSVVGLGAAPFVCVVGRLDPAKGQDLALAAFERAAPPDWHLVLAGSRTDATFARALDEGAARLAPRVHLLGGVPPATARALLAEARLVVVPSRAEAFGLVLLEAWAEGAPTLFSDVGGLSDLAHDGEASAGRVTPVDVEGWTEALRRVLARPEALEAEARRGPAIAAGYSWRSVAERVAAAYERAVRR